MKKQSLVAVMPVGRQDVHMDFCFEDSIDKSMLLCYFTTPSTFWLSFQRLRVSQSCLGMVVKFANESQSLLVSFWLISKEIFQVCLSLFFDDNLILAHRLRIYLSSSSTFAKLLPGCFSARSNLAKNSYRWSPP